MPVIPKESLDAFLPPLTVATPAPKVSKNGTVTGPVVTPPESKAIEIIASPFFPSSKQPKAKTIK